jgi:hypothetical protein
MNEVAQPTDDSTPLTDRWGGWYVTGQLKGVAHLGDLLPTPGGHIPASAVHPQDLAHLVGLFDTRTYLTDTSDVVALLVLEHEAYIHDLIIRAGYKSRWLMERQQAGSGSTGLTWDKCTPATQRRLAGLLEPLVRGLLFSGAAPLSAPVRGDPAYAHGFEARGPRDSQGRSLRDFDLDKRLFKYPLSFLVYSDGFRQLPPVAQAFVLRRIGEVLTGADQSANFSHLSAADRKAILEIVTATSPGLARAFQAGAAPAPHQGG